MRPFIVRPRLAPAPAAPSLNPPGNWLIGGGGGIGLLAGMSGIARWAGRSGIVAYPAYLLAAIVAVSPVPIMFLLGYSFLPL